MEENISISDNKKEEGINASSFFSITDFMKVLCKKFDITYESLFNTNSMTLFLEQLFRLKNENDILFLDFLILVSDISETSIVELDLLPFDKITEIFLQLLFYPAKAFEDIKKDFDIASYDSRVELYRKRILDSSEERNQECSKTKVDWFDPGWWRVFVFKVLREAGVSQEWLMNNDFKIIIAEWLSLQDASELRAAIEFDDKVMREIEEELNKPIQVEVGGKTIEVKNKNLRLQRKNLLKKYYKEK